MGRSSRIWRTCLDGHLTGRESKKGAAREIGLLEEREAGCRGLIM